MRTVRLPTFEKLGRTLERTTIRYKRGTIDLDRPRREERRLAASARKAVENVDAETLASELHTALRSLSTRRFAPTRVRVPRNARAALITTYLAAVEAELPFLPLLVFQGSFFTDFIAKAMIANDRLEQASYGGGEPRAEALRVAADYLEVTYHEMVAVLYELECVRSDRIIPNADFGNMLDSLVAWTRGSLPGFLDPEAARIRNAAHHYHWHLDDATGVIFMHNENHKGVSWRASTTMPALYKRLRSMHADIDHFATAIASHSSNAFLDQVVPLFGAGESEDWVETLGAALPSFLMRAFKPVLAKLEECKWTPRRTAAASLLGLKT